MPRGWPFVCSLFVAALCCSPVAFAASTHHGSRHHHPVHRRHHHRHRPVRPKPTADDADDATAAPTQTLPTTTLPTTLPTLPAPSPTPPAYVKGADLGIVSITPNVTHAKVGDLVTFTIVAENYGPDSGEIDVNTAKAVEGLMGGGSTSTNCGIINGPPPQPGTFGNDGSGCEDIGSFPPGTTVIDTLIALIAPTSTGVASDTACTWSAAGTNDPNPSNDCATATVTVDSTTCPAGMPGAAQTLDGHTYNLEGEDTFTKDAPLGSFASTDMNAVVYTGDHGMGWTEYPDGWPSTYSGKGVEGYSPSTVQSVHDGMLDFYLHDRCEPLPGWCGSLACARREPLSDLRGLVVLRASSPDRLLPAL